MTKKVKMGYNFMIRPKSNLGKREMKNQLSHAGEIEKYLSKMRKKTKNF